MEAKLDIDMRQLVRKLDRLPDRVATRVLSKSLNFGATAVIKAAKADMPVVEGTLKRSMGKKNLKDGDRVAVLAGPRITGGARGYHGHLVHDGHINVDGSFTPGNPFVKRASDSVQSEVRRRTADKLGKEIEKEAMK